ncbi:unnamed protein product [Phyllotreta striolata]|uniref:tRNA (uracil-O(2)-)-methyltransferase n=1 Tax=Phyllotreta striolata TaxID=444603 RepID=A0A9N9U1A9_PHYSR|nr:unnamed protein product [Phyllotreta striolata]
MFPVPLVTSSECFTPSLFWEVVQLYHNRPFLANKLITAVTKVLFYRTSSSHSNLIELFSPAAVLYEKRRLKSLSKESISVDFIKSFIEPFDKNVLLTESNEEEFNTDLSNTFISVQLLMSRRNTDHVVLEIAIFDKDKNSAVFIGVYEEKEETLTPRFPYQFHCSGRTFKINLLNFEDADSPQAEWLADVLFPKLVKWSECEAEKKSPITTLSLVPADTFSVIYSRLKKTYVADLLKDWSAKTSTDPQKYIFEDLAIASYLICIWQEYNKEDIYFVDCGCGNGLLVYVLVREGYKGRGIDIRKRPVWDIYRNFTNELEVGTVRPESSYPEATWLIGNHSDELTPWIPVMALRSSSRTNFFVLPCCPFDFDGRKYVRRDTSVSSYTDYLNYVKSVCDRCNFTTKMDKLRIPSTKKICLIGVNNNGEDEIKVTLRDVEGFVESKMSGEFRPRSAVEPVRNCTQINRNIVDKLIHFSVKLLTESEDFIEKSDGGRWNKGSTISILDVSMKVDKGDLRELKSQCGGLQTLFRNFRYIFETSGGNVRLRIPPTIHVTKGKYKNKPCWFQKNHPDGCFNADKDCSYLHE